ncbi:MAG: hemin uptake protein HemP [Planctomycetaceae bacterium]
MATSQPDPSGHLGDDAKGADASSLPRIRFEEISGGHSEVQVEFRGQVYRLRVTKNGKLILNK